MICAQFGNDLFVKFLVSVISMFDNPTPLSKIDSINHPSADTLQKIVKNKSGSEQNQLHLKYFLHQDVQNVFLDIRRCIFNDLLTEVR